MTKIRILTNFAFLKISQILALFLTGIYCLHQEWHLVLKQSIGITWGVLFLILIFIGAFASAFYKKDDDLIANIKNATINFCQTFLGISVLFLVTSFVFRAHSFYQISPPNTFFTVLSRGFLTDFYTLRYFLPVFLFCGFYQLSRLLTLDHLERKKFFRPLQTIFSVVLVLFFAFLWGWLPELGRFPGLEIFYVIKASSVSFSWSYLVVALVLIILIFFMGRQKVGIGRAGVIKTLILGASFPVLFVLLVFAEPTQLFLESSDQFSESGKGYVGDYNTFLKRTVLFGNPLADFAKLSGKEFLTVLYCNVHKRWNCLLPLLTPPQVGINSDVLLERIGPLLTPHEKITHPSYPAYRTRISNGPSAPYNVVIIVLETYTTPDSDVFMGRPNPMPFMTDLQKESLSFKHCFANAQASHEGESAVSSSLPIWGLVNAGRGGLLQSSHTKSFLSLLKEKGYRSFFSTTWELRGDKDTSRLRQMQILWGNILKHFQHSPADPYRTKIDHYTYGFFTAGIENIEPLWGEYLSKKDVPFDRHRNDETQAGTCFQSYDFIDDEYGYQKLTNQINTLQEPFFLVTHTESSHLNWVIPKGHKSKKDLSIYERYYDSVRYADYALQKFFEKVKKSPRFKNTVFILVSDHTAGCGSGFRHLPLYDKYHIPLLIYAPHLIQPRQVDQPAFQLDIGPTILSLLNLSGAYTTFGTDLTATKMPQRGMILPDWDGYLVFVYDPYILKLDTENIYELYNFRENKYKNLVNYPEYRDIKAALFKEFQTTYRIFSETLYSNKIMPSSPQTSDPVLTEWGS